MEVEGGGGGSFFLSLKFREVRLLWSSRKTQKRGNAHILTLSLNGFDDQEALVQDSERDIDACPAEGPDAKSCGKGGCPSCQGA